MNDSTRISGVYLKADTINGVYKIDASDITGTDEVSPPKIFLACLKDMADGEYAIAHFDGNSEEIYDEIEKTYGIRKDNSILSTALSTLY